MGGGEYAGGQGRKSQQSNRKGILDGAGSRRRERRSVTTDICGMITLAERKGISSPEPIAKEERQKENDVVDVELQK